MTEHLTRLTKCSTHLIWFCCGPHWRGRQATHGLCYWLPVNYNITINLLAGQVEAPNSPFLGLSPVPHPLLLPLPPITSSGSRGMAGGFLKVLHWRSSCLFAAVIVFVLLLNLTNCAFIGDSSPSRCFSLECSPMVVVWASVPRPWVSRYKKTRCWPTIIHFFLEMTRSTFPINICHRHLVFTRWRIL